MTKLPRIVVFACGLILLGALYWWWNGALGVPQPVRVTIFSSLILLSFTVLFLEHYFTRPTDVLAASISVLLVMSPLKGELGQTGIWYSLLYLYAWTTGIAAFLGILLFDAESPRDSTQNNISQFFSTAATRFGNGRFLFFCLFFMCLVFYVDSQSWEFLGLSAYAAVIGFLNPQKNIFGLFAVWTPKPAQELGQIFGVQSKNTFLARLLPHRKPVRRFDFVQFRYSMASADKIFRGMIVDNYLLNEQQWVKVLCSKEIDSLEAELSDPKELTDNLIYDLQVKSESQFLDRFVGVIVEGSDISKIKFEYAQKVDVEEGNIVGVRCRDKLILYQVVQGQTEIEQLEQKNESGMIVGEAIQLGSWNAESQRFERFGWVPEINSPLLIANPDHTAKLQDGESVVGCLPGTGLPVIIDRELAVTHHLAILGVTGTGKSVFARDLVRKVATDGTKVICVDFTNEYKGTLSDIGAGPLIDEQPQNEILTRIQRWEKEMAEFKNNRNETLISTLEKEIEEFFVSSLEKFFDSDQSVRIFDLPDIFNSTGLLEYTRMFFRSLFNMVRSSQKKLPRICVVLEEAHTVIPEWNFVGVDSKPSQAAVNSISQIALQGRKYGIGFIVVAQRTANVSKTVLTQCNSIIAFRHFDKTSAEFLSNHLGKEMLDAIPSLKDRQAIAAGKAFRSSTPMIFDVPNIKEPKAKPEEPVVAAEAEAEDAQPVAVDSGPA